MNDEIPLTKIINTKERKNVIKERNKISNTINKFIVNPSSRVYYKSGLIKEINNEKYIVIQRG